MVSRASGRLYKPESRKARTDRVTKETSVSAQVNLSGSGQTNVNTGIAFIDHLITSIGKHSLVDVTLTGKSNDGIVHHLAEDVAITLAQTLDKALGDRSHIARFGYALVPMDESLALSSIDLIKRPYHHIQLNLTRDIIEEVPKEDLEHFVRSLCQNLNACTHIVVQYGENDHHKVEAALKAFAVALRMAISVDSRRRGVPSTKGAM